ncbi:MAG TPA: tRNA-binding protein [Gemmatimonadales bacterium]|nr:tRNA-binding protein [Gemmatimonadales bacterium]
MADQPMPRIPFEHFAAVDMRVGRVVRAEDFPRARKPAYKLWIDFGPLGMRQSSAQLTNRYQRGELEGRLVVAVMNLGPRQVADFRSDVLVLGAMGPGGDVILLEPDREAALGAPIG